MPLDHPALRGSRALVFAHRGGATLMPENTVAAFDHGLALGADGLELDVRLSCDGVPMVIHDADLARTTNAAGAVSSRTADEIGRLDAAYRFQPDRGFPLRGQGIGVPRLRDVLRRYADRPLIIELKGGDPALARAVVDEVRAAGAVERVCVGGYSGRAIRAARAYDPGVATGASRGEVRWALYRSWLGRSVAPGPYRAFQVPEYAGRTRVVSARFARAAREAGVALQVFWVNAVDDMHRLLDLGVDALISDRPDVAVQAIRSRSPARP